MSDAAAPVSTRDRLIDAAFRVIAREGLDAASVKAIAAEAGVRPGLMHYHFATKDAVIEAALRRGVEQFAARGAARRARLPQGEQLDALVAELRDAITSEQDFYRMRLALAARALTHPPTATLLAAQSAAAIEEMTRALAAAAGEEPTEQYRVMARVAKAMFDGFMLATLTDPTFPAAAAADRIEQALRGWLAD